MNQTIKELFDRRSVRVYTDRKIPAEEKQLILQAAFQAPTAGDQQLYTIIDVTDPEMKQKLAVSCDNQPFIASGEMVLVFLADCRKWYDSFRDADCEPREPGTGDFLLAVCDTLIAAQNAVVAAESLGIGSCYIGDIMEQYEYHRDLFHLPDYVFPAAMLVFGYPTEQQLARKKPPRAKPEYVVYENAYPEWTPEQRKALMSTYAGSREYQDWITAFCKRKYNSDFSREMTRSVEAFLKQFHKD